jgi:hypothetical protein
LKDRDAIAKSNLKAKLLLSEMLPGKQSSCTKRIKMRTKIPKESR